MNRYNGRAEHFSSLPIPDSNSGHMSVENSVSLKYMYVWAKYIDV